MMPGLVRIGWVQADLLPDFYSYLLPDNPEYEPQWIELVESGTLSEEISSSALGSDVKTTVEFASSEDIPVNRQIGLIVEDAVGSRYVVGNAPPHCGVLKKNYQINEPSGKASVNYYSFSVPVPKYKI